MRHYFQTSLFLRALIFDLLCVYLVPLSSVAQASSPSSLETALQQKYLNRVYVLRGFYQENGLHFDSAGVVQGHPHPGPWTLAIIAVQKIKISNNKVQLEGSRFAEIYDSKQAKLVTIPAHTPIKIDIDRDSSQPDSKVIAAISRVFIQQEEHLSDLVPDYWKPYLSGKVETVPQEKGDDCYRIRDQFSREEDGKILRACEENAKIKAIGTEKITLNPLTLPYTSGWHIKRPKAKSAPSPSYGPYAHEVGYEGTAILWVTISAEGTISDLFIARPAGLDLDDSAAKAVKTWIFKPAMLGGQAIPVRTTIEVNFKK